MVAPLFVEVPCTVRWAVVENAKAIRAIVESAYRICGKDFGRPPAPMVADLEHHIAQDSVGR